MHRPPGLTGVPVSIFSSVFADFTQWCDTINIDAKDLSVAHSFMHAMSLFHSTEDERYEAANRIIGVREAKIIIYLLLLQGYLGLTEAKIGSYTPDAVVTASDAALVAIVKFKNELSTDKCCPILQTAAYYQAHVAQHPDNVGGHLPCFLIAIAGPHMFVFGAVRAYRILIDPLVSVMLHYQVVDPRPVERVARTLKSLKQAIAQLQQSYNRTNASAVQVAFPPWTSITGHAALIPPKISFRFVGPIGPKPLYRVVDTGSSAEMILKFTAYYNVEVHDFCARSNYAPQIRGYEKPTSSGFHVILMDAVPNDFLLYAVHPPTGADKEMVVEKLRNLLSGLQDAKYVHGDFRPTNIFYRIKDGRAEVRLIDFEFSGKAGDGVYPLTINPAPGVWHPDVRAGAALECVHDEFWLQRLVDIDAAIDYQPPFDTYPEMIKYDLELDRVLKEIESSKKRRIESAHLSRKKPRYERH